MEKTHLDPALAPRTPDGTPAPRGLGGYRLLRLLGEGGMGAVYLGWKEGEAAQVAVKVLNDQLAGSQGYIDRFYREARSGKLLNHPNVVRTLGYGQDEETHKHYLVMEYVDGPSAQALLARLGRLSVGDAVHVALDVARALEHAHSRNLIHRDIKPDNILVTRAGVAKLADLGLAKRTDEASHLTSAHQGFGTTPYMPYEQAVNARSADHRGDLYALGATLYHFVTGAVPFPGDSHLDVVEMKRAGEFLPASSLNPEAPPALDAILARLLARLPGDRYQTASELIVDLERSRLAATPPSFADPELASKDPWVQACLASAADPTRLDPERPPPEPEPEDVWLLRFRNRAGRVCRTHATTDQIIARMRDGRLPERVAARRPSQAAFRPLASFAEFRPYSRARTAGAKSPRPKKPVPPISAVLAPPAPGVARRRLLLLAAAAVAGLAAVGAAAGAVGRLLFSR